MVKSKCVEERRKCMERMKKPNNFTKNIYKNI